MAEPKTVLMVVTGAGRAPTLQEAAEQLHLDVSALSAEFGVIAIDADHGRYAVQVDASALPPGTLDSGTFSNPPIAPFGPLQPGRAKPKSDPN